MSSRSVILLLSAVLVLWCASALSASLSCESCGRECTPSCGTRNFRTCCFNYLRKRSDPEASDSALKLELMMVIPELLRKYPSLKQLIQPQANRSPDHTRFLYEDDLKELPEEH